MELGGTEFELYRKINQEDLTQVFKNKDTYGKIYDVTVSCILIEENRWWCSKDVWDLCSDEVCDCTKDKFWESQLECYYHLFLY